MPGRDGLEVLKDIKRERQDLPVLVEAIRTIALGRKYITASSAEKLTQQLDAGYRKVVHEKLSDREYQVMCMIAGWER